MLSFYLLHISQAHSLRTTSSNTTLRLVFHSSLLPSQLRITPIKNTCCTSQQVADRSPIPILIYSYPGVTSGLEISSDTFAILGKHPNIVGVKQTDHLVGKMARNAYNLRNDSFLVFGGGSDYLIGSLAVGAAGAITGLANVAPRTVLRLVKLWEEGKREEALELQGQVSNAEAAIVTGGVPAFKVRASFLVDDLIVFVSLTGCIITSHPGHLRCLSWSSWSSSIPGPTNRPQAPCAHTIGRRSDIRV